jgi:hypothetical protein
VSKQRRPRTYKHRGIPECPLRMQLEMFCAVPECRWKQTLYEDGKLPRYRQVYEEHWMTAHHGDHTLLAGVDMSSEGLEKIRRKRELDAIRDFTSEGEK